uniref:Uncharacterized protein n=1 Tax=Anopheles minimus TaxID=112268 RepID=A0A182VQT6_9DIPT
MFTLARHHPSANEVHYAELALAIPHDDTSGKNHLNNHLNKLPPPPAYNYFDEPTIYAQIDHGGSFKTVGPPPHPSATIPSSVGSSAAANSFPLISPVSQQQQHHHHPLTLQLQQDATQPASSHHHHAPHTPHTPTTASLLQLSQPLAQHHGAVLAHSPLQLPHNLPQSPSIPTANGNGSKQYLREIVTVRTPLAFSQQESCV